MVADAISNAYGTASADCYDWIGFRPPICQDLVALRYTDFNRKGTHFQPFVVQANPALDLAPNKAFLSLTAFRAMRTVIYYTVTIDTEEEWDWTGPFPVAPLQTTNIQELSKFQRICDDTGARPTYFVNHAVMSDSASADKILQLGGQENVEIGMHIHPWNTPPIASMDVAREETFIHNLPDALAREKLEVTYATFAQHNLSPTSFRGGRYSSGPVVKQFLIDHGFQVDASVCPFSTWPDPGAPNYWERGMEPTPLAQRESGPTLWDVPLSRAFSRKPFRFWRDCFDLVENSWLTKLRLIGIAERLNLIRRLWLNFECEPLRNLQTFVNLAPKWGLKHICFTVHSSSLAVGPGPYCRSEQDHERIHSSIRSIFEQLENDSRYQPLTMSELADTLEEVPR